jgi:hypothetical protein
MLTTIQNLNTGYKTIYLLKKSVPTENLKDVKNILMTHNLCLLSNNGTKNQVEIR